VPAARDPFRILDLPLDAGAGDVRRAFRRRAHQTHPDRGGAADDFLAVRTAYSALCADLEGERRRWRAAPVAPPRTAAPSAAGGPDPAAFPTCPVRTGRTREGRRTMEYAVEARPAGWRPGAAAPPGGVCVARVAAAEGAPAFGVWVVPLDAERVRVVFGPVG
jgi:hypothetical protein